MSRTTDHGPVGLAGMAGPSISGRDAAPWVTDLLDAPLAERIA